MADNDLIIRQFGGELGSFYCPGCGRQILRAGQLLHTEWCDHVLGAIGNELAFIPGPKVTRIKAAAWQTVIDHSAEQGYEGPEDPLLMVMPERAFCFLLIGINDVGERIGITSVFLDVDWKRQNTADRSGSSSKRLPKNRSRRQIILD
ncbi:hypothetical protein [Rhizomicrobium electricum]|uniref:C2H2-type domain-containing protein n=1 Tax=Rhizomicrobium electricum TaxID=480070 RepID=A0ABN1FBD4_9PROT|nr:hypothetical protein [Rhizomicrobium electricum]NIJ50737.1 hypothetical protein [Rhizomicrobium electricum]